MLIHLCRSLAVFVVFAAWAAGPVSAKSALTDTDGVLRYVPDNTPYVLASGAPLPDAVLDQLEPGFENVLQSYQVFMREIMQAEIDKDDGDVSADERERFAAVIDEITSLMSIQGMRDAGIERDSGMVVYGHGLLPVFRLELDDAAKFEAVIERMEDAAGETMQTDSVGKETYRYIGDAEGRLIVALIDDNAIFTVAPNGIEEKQLKLLLGLSAPRNNIARSGRLQNIVDENDFSEHYVGFVDAERLASFFIDKPTGLNALLIEDSEFDPATLTDVCKDEIRDTVSAAPRVVFGYDEISTKAMKSTMIVEVRQDIATGLAGLTALVPGMGIDPGGLMSFGISMNIPAIRAFAESRITALEENPYECEHFADFQAGVATGRAALAQPVPPFIDGMRGFNVIVDSLGDYDFSSAQPPQDVDASVVFSLDDAQAMFMMGSMMSPDLASLDLQPDGNPVPLALPQLQAFAEFSYAAMADTALAVSIGSDAKARVTTVLNANAAEPPPFLSTTMDAGKYYELIAESMYSEPDVAVEGEGDSEEYAMPESAQAALREAMLAVGEIYDRMAVDVRFTPRGIVVESIVTFTQ